MREREKKGYNQESVCSSVYVQSHLHSFFFFFFYLRKKFSIDTFHDVDSNFIYAYMSTSFSVDQVLSKLERMETLKQSPQLDLSVLLEDREVHLTNALLFMFQMCHIIMVCCVYVLYIAELYYVSFVTALVAHSLCSLEDNLIWNFCVCSVFCKLQSKYVSILALLLESQWYKVRQQRTTGALVNVHLFPRVQVLEFILSWESASRHFIYIPAQC